LKISDLIRCFGPILVKFQRLKAKEDRRKRISMVLKSKPFEYHHKKERHETSDFLQVTATTSSGDEYGLAARFRATMSHQGVVEEVMVEKMGAEELLPFIDSPTIVQLCYLVQKYGNLKVFAEYRETIHGEGNEWEIEFDFPEALLS